MKKYAKYLSLCLLVLLVLQVIAFMPEQALAYDVSLSATIDKNVASLNETINIRYSISGWRNGMWLQGKLGIINPLKNNQKSYGEKVFYNQKIQSSSGVISYQLDNNQGEYCEIILTVYDQEVDGIDSRAPKLASYVSPTIQIKNGKRRESGWEVNLIISKTTLNVGETITVNAKKSNQVTLTDNDDAAGGTITVEGPNGTEELWISDLPMKFTYTPKSAGRYRFCQLRLTGDLTDHTYWWYTAYSDYFDVVDKNSQYRMGWQKENGVWFYYQNGNRKTGWLKDGNSWYYLDRNGRMLTGWQKINNAWYYMSSSGQMLTGWQKINGKWYFFNASGAMVTGWLKDAGTWYYLEASGEMVTGTKKIQGVTYYFDTAGAMATGWRKLGGVWYYYEASGAMKTGWLKLGGSWYYLDNKGVMVTGRKNIEGKWHVFNNSGVWLGEAK